MTVKVRLDGGGRSPKYLVLGRKFLVLPLQPLNLGEEGIVLACDIIEFALEIFDVALFALTEGSLTVQPTA